MARLIVLFLCTGNSCRSQMAEGWARDAATVRTQASAEEALRHDRRVRDEIRAFVEQMPKVPEQLRGAG